MRQRAFFVEVRRKTKFRGSWVSLLAIGAKNGAIEVYGDLVDAQGCRDDIEAL